MRRNRIVYALLSIGLIGGFLGHGMWAVGANEKFLLLFSGTFENLFGLSLAEETTKTWVQAIGYVDLAIAVVLVLMLIGNLRAKGALYAFAYGQTALAVYAWGAVWGFLTAGARVTAAGQFYPELWDVIERAPNFMLPAALVYLVYQHRLDHRPAETVRPETRATAAH